MGAGTGRPRVQGCGEGTAPAQGGGGSAVPGSRVRPSCSGDHFDPKVFSQLFQEDKGKDGVRNEANGSGNEALQWDSEKGVSACFHLDQECLQPDHGEQPMCWKVGMALGEHQTGCIWKEPCAPGPGTGPGLHSPESSIPTLLWTLTFIPARPPLTLTYLVEGERAELGSLHGTVHDTLGQEGES